MVSRLKALQQAAACQVFGNTVEQTLRQILLDRGVPPSLVDARVQQVVK